MRARQTVEKLGAVCFFLTVACAQGQRLPEIQWQRSFGGSTNDIIRAVKQTGDGGYILGGPSASGVSGNRTNVNFGTNDFWVVKVDANGNKQWDKAFGGTGDDFLYDLQLTSDGGYLLGGYSTSSFSGNKATTSYGLSDFWIVKLDANGNKQWEKVFGGSGVDELHVIQPTSDGGYILGGDSASGISGNKTAAGYGGVDYWLVKVDANGNKQWDRAFGGTMTDGLYALQQTTNDSGFILGGFSYSGVSGNKGTANFGFSDAWLVKVDSSGNMQWEQAYGGSSIDGIDALDTLRQTSDGGYILGIGSYSGATGNKTSAGFGASDLWLVKTDSNGVKEWEQAFGGSHFDYFRCLQLTDDGGYMLGSGSESLVTGNKSSTNYGAADYWILKLDSNGNEQWEQTFGGSTHDSFFNLQLTSDGGYVLGGYSQSGVSGSKTTTNFGGRDFWLVKLWTPVRFNSYSLAVNNEFQAQLSGLPGSNYILQASTDLTNWTSLITNTAAPDGLVNFSDSNASSFPFQFYRAQQQP